MDCRKCQKINLEKVPRHYEENVPPPVSSISITGKFQSVRRPRHTTDATCSPQLSPSVPKSTCLPRYSRRSSLLWTTQHGSPLLAALNVSTRLWRRYCTLESISASMDWSVRVCAVGAEPFTSLKLRKLWSDGQDWLPTSDISVFEDQCGYTKRKINGDCEDGREHHPISP